jgi:hypothetical protein
VALSLQLGGRRGFALLMVLASLQCTKKAPPSAPAPRIRWACEYSARACSCTRAKSNDVTMGCDEETPCCYGVSPRVTAGGQRFPTWCRCVAPQAASCPQPGTDEERTEHCP